MSVAECLQLKEPPTLQRKDLMSFSTINANDAPMKNFKKLNTTRDWSLNLYNLDIDKSTPKKISIYSDKIDFINKNDDIEKSQCPKEHPFLNKKCFSLTNLDIEKSTPNSTQFKTNRITNPLMPIYKLPKGKEYIIEKPKFIRDSINIDDIKCAHPKNYSLLKRELSDNLFTIENSKIRRGFNRQTKYEYIDYSDIKPNNTFKSTRCTNPLDPIYHVSYKNKKGDGFDKFTYGFIEKSKPQTFSPFIMNHNFNLRNDDIYGSNVGSKNYISKFHSTNGYLNIQDIEKTNAGSLKNYIDTLRNTNPIWPRYAFPGHKMEFTSSLSNNFLSGGYGLPKSSSCKNFNSPEIKILAPSSPIDKNKNSSRKNSYKEEDNTKNKSNQNKENIESKEEISINNNKVENGIAEDKNNINNKNDDKNIPDKDDSNNTKEKNIDENKNKNDNKNKEEEDNKNIDVKNDDNNKKMKLNKIKVPNNFNLKHDKYLYPFNGKEENKKNNGLTNAQNFVYNKVFENKNLKCDNKKSDNKELLLPKVNKTPNYRSGGGPLTYSEKLGLFMSKNNLNFVNEDKPKQEQN